MLQNIEPKFLNNQYAEKRAPADGDRVFFFRNREVLACDADELEFPRYADVRGICTEVTYLFRVDDEAYFLARDGFERIPEGTSFIEVRPQRTRTPQYKVYALMTAYHLSIWYRDNRFCGRCGAPTRHDEKLRMLSCPSCGNMIFPKICPAVIVAVTDGDRIMLTQYKGRAYKNYALIAGFTEIGETAEQTVAREVMEEVGVKVKNIVYRGTQPWGVDTDLLLGFSAQLDGDDTVTRDDGELSAAAWFKRSEVPVPANRISLTNDLIFRFLEGEF